MKIWTTNSYDIPPTIMPNWRFARKRMAKLTKVNAHFTRICIREGLKPEYSVSNPTRPLGVNLNAQEKDTWSKVAKEANDKYLSLVLYNLNCNIQELTYTVDGAISSLKYCYGENNEGFDKAKPMLDKATDKLKGPQKT